MLTYKAYVKNGEIIAIFRGSEEAILEGLREGRPEGIREGIREGIKVAKLEAAQGLLANSRLQLTVKDIAESLGLSFDDVRKIKAEMKAGGSSTGSA